MATRLAITKAGVRACLTFSEPSGVRSEFLLEVEAEEQRTHPFCPPQLRPNGEIKPDMRRLDIKAPHSLLTRSAAITWSCLPCALLMHLLYGDFLLLKRIFPLWNYTYFPPLKAVLFPVLGRKPPLCIQAAFIARFSFPYWFWGDLCMQSAACVPISW